MGRAEPGARRRRSTCRSARTGGSSSCAASWPTSSTSRTRSAARSTTSCSPSWRARCAAGCSRAACAPRGSSCARSSRSRSARADEHGHARQPARRDARAAAGLRRGPGRAAAGRARRRWTASRSPSRRSAPRCSPSVQNLAPPTVLAQASRMNFSTRLFNLLVTNVPGPQFPLYALGRELQDLFPVAFLPEQPRARRRDHVLQRRNRLRAARRLRRDARPRRSSPRCSRRRGTSCWRRRARSAASNGKRPSSPKRTSRPRTSSPASTEA